MLIKEIDFFKDIFNAYPQQREFYRAFFSGKYKFFIENVHRRFGKDAEFFNLAWLVSSMWPGNYLYTLPKIGQAKNVIWEGTDLNGRRWIDTIPPHLIANENKSDRKLYFTSGSMLHITGADSILGAHLGSNLRGLFMSEFQRTNPTIWDYLRPIINRNPQAFACFNWTSFGQNHAWKLMQANKDKPNWHIRKLTVEDTRDNDGNYIFSPEQIQAERDSGMDEDLIQQEYYCDDTVAVKGTFFAESLEKARQEGRIKKRIEVYPGIPVHTSWDLGSRDTNVIWFFQVLGTGKQSQFNYFLVNEKNYGDVEFYVELMKKVQKEYGFSRYGHHFLPHDSAITEWGSGKTRRVQLMQKGLNITPVPMLRVIERVQVARSNFDKCFFDEEGCKNGLEALAVSRAKWDANLKAFTADEVHDWSSHASAAFQYGHVGWSDTYNKPHLAKQREYAKLRPLAR